jgi:hypothetical protein
MAEQTNLAEEDFNEATRLWCENTAFQGRKAEACEVALNQ